MIGKLDTRVTIKPLTKSATGTGGFTESYASNNLTRWASIDYLTQSRVTDGGTLVMVNTVKFQLWWDSSLEAIMDKTSIITFDSVNYTIKDFKLDTIKSNYFYTIIATSGG